MPSLAIAPILKAMKAALAQPTEANIFALADAANLTIKKESLKIEVVEHTTKKGKVIKGVVRTDLSYSEAKAIDEFTFKKNGGWFIREKHFGQGQESKPVTAQSEPIASVKSDVLVSDQDNGIDALKVKFKPASSQYKTASIRFDPKDGAKLLKQTLTKLFPDTKFSVVMGRGTGYGSVDVSWIDGASIDLVSVVTDHFQGKGFSSIDDSTIYKNSVNEAGEVVDYGLGYVSYRRTYSKGFLERFLKNIPENLKRWVVQYGVGVDGSDSDAYFTKINEYWAKKELYDALQATSTGKYRLGNTPKTNNNPQAIEAEVLPAEQAQIDADIEAKAEILEKYGFINNVTGRWKYNTENGGYPRFTANSKQGAVEAVWPYFLKVPKNELRTAEGKFNDANVRLIEEMDKRYGHLSDDEIVKLIGRLGGEIASLQSAGQQEMDGLGGRRTGAAVANEGARATGQERMHLEIYLRNRKEAADKATNTFNSTAYNRPLSEKLALLRQFADNPNDENAQALADAVGVKIVKPLSAPVAPVITQSTDETSEAFGEQANKDIAQPQANTSGLFGDTDTFENKDVVSEYEIFAKYKNAIAMDIVKEIRRVENLMKVARSKGKYSSAEHNRKKIAQKWGVNPVGWGTFDKMFGYALEVTIRGAFSGKSVKYTDQDIHDGAIRFINEWLASQNNRLDDTNHFNDIGGFNFTPAIDLDQTLKAIKETLANGSHDNIKRLATLAGLTLKEPEPDVDLDMFGEPINQDFDLFGEPIQDDEESPVEELPRLAVVELPLNKLSLSEDVPQFKSGADGDTGVVEALGGKFDRTGVAPIQVWERLDGRLEIISGRHRTDLARRSGEKTIPAQVHKESEGFTAKQAMMLDAELNIRDGQGKVKDYVDYFTHSGISKAEADSRGLISRSIGQRAFAIASQGSDELKTLHRNDLISDQAAADIANLSPNNSAMQAVGLRVLQEHKPLNNALNTMRAVMALTREKGQEPDTFDLFGFDDSAMKEAEAMAKIASRKQRLIAEQLTAIKGAVKNPKLAAKHGVIVENEADALAKVQAMTAQKARWDNWSSYSDLLAEVRSELADSHNSLSQSDYGDDDAAYWFWRETVDCFNSQQAVTSKDIQTLEGAEAYWQEKFADKKLKLVVTSGKTKGGMPKKIAIKVFFDAKNNHAFTKDENKTGSNALRLFNAERAQAIDKIIPTIESPNTRLKHHGADLLFERLIDGKHFTVVLQWQPFQEYYRFQSAHFQTAEQVKLLLKTKDARKGEGPL